MKVIKATTFRSAGRGVNKTDDMVRATVDMTLREFRALPDVLAGAMKVELPDPVFENDLGLQRLREAHPGMTHEAGFLCDLCGEYFPLTQSLHAQGKSQSYRLCWQCFGKVKGKTPSAVDVMLRDEPSPEKAALDKFHRGFAKVPGFLLFSQRMTLARRYQDWLASHDEDEPEIDCPESVILFLLENGLLVGVKEAEQVDDLVRRYSAWLIAPAPQGMGGKAKDCPETVIAFLCSEGALGRNPADADELDRKMELLGRLKKEIDLNAGRLEAAVADCDFGKAAGLSGLLAGLRLARRLAEHVEGPGLFGDGTKSGRFKSDRPNRSAEPREDEKRERKD